MGEMVIVPGKMPREATNCKERRKERRRKAREAVKNGLVFDEVDIDTSKEEDQRIQMREGFVYEGFSQSLLLRITDFKYHHHVTICGGTVGRQSGNDILVEDPTLSRKLLEFVLVPESNSFVLKEVTAKSHVDLNDYELKANDAREIGHGNFLRLRFEFLRVHVYFGKEAASGIGIQCLATICLHLSLSIEFISVYPEETITFLSC